MTLPDLRRHSGLIIALATLWVMATLVPACASKTGATNGVQSYQQETFAEYVTATRQWIEANRVFVTDDHAREIEANTPYESKPETPSRRHAASCWCTA